MHDDNDKPERRPLPSRGDYVSPHGYDRKVGLAPKCCQCATPLEADASADGSPSGGGVDDGDAFDATPSGRRTAHIFKN